MANRDGTTGFERILPGPDRMYPDTDTPPIPVADSLVEQIRLTLPATPWKREERYMGLGLDRAKARQLARSWWADLFDAANPSAGPVARRLAAALAKRMPYHARVRTSAPVLDPDKLRALAALTDAKEIRLEAMDRLVDSLINEPDTPVDEFAARYSVDVGDAARLDLVIDQVTRRAGALTGRSAGALLRWGMGGVMPQFLGRIDPAVVRRRLAASLEAAVSEVVT
jgi:glutamyl-tRNA(Gln) amidotransferase subunit E